MQVAVVSPVYLNEATLEPLARRLATALDQVHADWRLRFVVDASPDASLAVAQHLAAGDTRIGVTVLPTNVGQNRALCRGLADEDGATAWVCLDADLQDPPEALPTLLARLARGDVDAVFAGRAGAYERRGRLLTGRAHRALVGRMAGVPGDAGAFVAMSARARAAIVRLGPPSVVAAIGVAGLRSVSVPVERSRRPSGRSAWTSTARLRQSARTLTWTARQRLR